MFCWYLRFMFYCRVCFVSGFIHPLYPIIQPLPCSFFFLSSTTAVLLVRSLFFVVVVSFRSRKEDNWSNPPTWMIMTRFTSLSKQPMSDRFFENLPPLFLVLFCRGKCPVLAPITPSDDPLRLSGPTVPVRLVDLLLFSSSWLGDLSFPQNRLHLRA